MAKPKTTAAKVPPTRAAAPSTREELERRRKGTVVTAPSGLTYRVRSIKLERHALAGGLPRRLRQIALGGPGAIDALFASDELDKPVEEGGEEGGTLGGYIDEIVCATVMEPALTPADFGDPTKLDDPDALVPGIDYKFLTQIAFGNQEYDALGGRVWGTEPLARWDTFRHFHGCEEDCESCSRLQAHVSEVLAG